MRSSVLLLHYSGPPLIGGVERVLGGQAKVMKRFGHPVGVAVGCGKVFHPEIPLYLVREMDSQDPEVLRVKKHLKEGKVPKEFYELRDRIKSQLLPLTSRYPLWIAHNLLTMPQNLALTAALHDMVMEGRISKLILWHHDVAWGNAHYRDFVHKGYPWELMRKPWPGNLQHVVISTMRRKQISELLGIPPEEIKVVPNGVDVEEFFRWKEITMSLLDRWQLLEADIILLQPVRITPRKDLDRALEIIKAMKELGGLDVRLLVTGPPDRHRSDGLSYLKKVLEYRRKLDLEDAVLFPCADPDPCEVTKEVLVDLFSIADGVLLTSEEEGFGLPVLEAGIARVPVFARRIPALVEVGGGYVHFFEPEDSPRDVAQMVLQVLERERAGRLRQRVRRHYLWDFIYRNHLASLLDEPEGGARSSLLEANPLSSFY